MLQEMGKWSDDRAFDFGLVYSMKLYMQSMAYILGSDSRAGIHASVFHGVKVDWLFTTNHQYISFLELVLPNLETWAYPVKLSPKKRLLLQGFRPQGPELKTANPILAFGICRVQQTKQVLLYGVTDADDLDSLGLWLK